MMRAATDTCARCVANLWITPASACGSPGRIALWTFWRGTGQVTRERVWHELRQLGDHVREPELARQAQAVCDEMALRARHNIEVIVDRLTAQGYRFHGNDDQQTPIAPIRTPTTGAAPLADWLLPL